MFVCGWVVVISLHVTAPLNLNSHFGVDSEKRREMLFTFHSVALSHKH